MIKAVLTGIHKYTEDELDSLRSLGYDVILHRKEKIPFSEEELSCEVLVHIATFLYNDLNDFKNLKFVQGLTVGLDKDIVPIEKMRERGIKFANARGVLSIPIAEFTVMRLLEVYRCSRYYDMLAKERKWGKKFDMEELYGKTAGIFGTGSIGSETAKRLQAFGVRTIGFDRTGKNKPFFEKVYSSLSDNIYEKLQELDVVIMALPESKETFHLANEVFFDCMKEKAVFVNIGRGSVTDEKALIDQMQRGRLEACILDVFEEEPLPEDSPLWEMDNFYFSPHNSFASNGNAGRRFELIYKNLAAYASGKEIVNLIK